MPSNAIIDVLLTSLIALSRKFSVDLNTETTKEAKDLKGEVIKATSPLNRVAKIPLLAL